MSRAENRHHAQRAKARARLIVKRVYTWVNPDDERRVAKLARTPKPCSGSCCSPSRAFNGPTMAERRFTCEGNDDG